MDDLSGLDWSSSSNPPARKHPAMNPGNYYPSLRPTPPLSGRTTPLSAQVSGMPKIPGPESNGTSRLSTPANDSFANLVSFNTAKPSKSLSLREQQLRLEEDRFKQAEARKKTFDERFGSDSRAWDELESKGRAVPERIVSPLTYAATDEYGSLKLSSALNKPFAALEGVRGGLQAQGSEVDLLAAFDAAAPVDSSSNFPKPEGLESGGELTMLNQFATTVKPKDFRLDEATPKEENMDEDLFGLGTAAAMTHNQTMPTSNVDKNDDILGMLGRPVSELLPTIPAQSLPTSISPKIQSDPLSKAVAELVEMGFPAEISQDALSTTRTGLDVQAAVAYLLNQAHSESRQRSQTPQLRDDRDAQQLRKPNANGRRIASPSTDAAIPVWKRRDSRSSSTQGREGNRSPANGEKDPAKYAAELGNNLFKTANSLWKTGTKKLNQAVSEANSDSDSTQPKWMRDAQAELKLTRSRQQRRSSTNEDEGPAWTIQRPTPQSGNTNITDEALMLESGDSHPRAREPRSTLTDPAKRRSGSSRNQSPAMVSLPKGPAPPPSKFIQQAHSTEPKPRSNREALEEQTSQAYISPARRKKIAPQSAAPNQDLIFDPASRSHPPTTLPKEFKSRSPLRSYSPASTIVTRPTAPKRFIPTVSPLNLEKCKDHRLAGSAAFKRGDYAHATQSYTVALNSLPSTHLLAIPLLTNRALTHLKMGDPKACLSDADTALAIIGSSRGEGETLEAGDGDGVKEMTLFWGKAMIRKAEALEQLERWAEAAKAWKECIEAGLGGSMSIQGRNRCEKAVGVGSFDLHRRPPPAQKPVSKPAPPVSNTNRLSSHPVASTSETEAVSRLRAANAVAERQDDEKFALADSVDERLTKWRKGREGNLRALLGSLETVLWEGSGWNKVGLSELVIPGKVKIVYMRGIGKVHPDKLPPTATMEQRMISANVFSVLNEAWDRFKRENGL